VFSQRRDPEDEVWEEESPNLGNRISHASLNSSPESLFILSLGEREGLSLSLVGRDRKKKYSGNELRKEERLWERGYFTTRRI